MKKLIVTVEIDLNTDPEIGITTKPILRETDKSYFTRNEQHVRNRTSPVYRVGPFNKGLLGKISTPRPNAARCHFALEDDKTPIRETPEFREVVRRMLDKLQAELIIAEMYHAQLEDSL